MKTTRMQMVKAKVIVTRDGLPASERWVFTESEDVDIAQERAELQMGFDEPLHVEDVWVVPAHLMPTTDRFGRSPVVRSRRGKRGKRP